jgi:REP element-mobilizing transposase RayT
MKFDPKIHHRHTIRLQGYDYSQSGAYYVTIVAHGRECLFGEIVDVADVGAGLRPAPTATMKLNEFGKIVQRAWFDLPKHYPHVELGTFCIMPNHVHAVIILIDVVAIKRHPLSEIVRAFKSFSARRINELRKMQGVPVWQRNYYEHIIRNAEEHNRIHLYIESNPVNWIKDNENPEMKK